MFNIATKTQPGEAPYRLIDFFTLELILLGGLVVLALVIIARKSKAP